jgi:hypothetical protein
MAGSFTDNPTPSENSDRIFMQGITQSIVNIILQDDQSYYNLMGASIELSLIHDETASIISGSFSIFQSPDETRNRSVLIMYGELLQRFKPKMINFIIAEFQSDDLRIQEINQPKESQEEPQLITKRFTIRYLTTSQT